jgi:hypothetical protein
LLVHSVSREREKKKRKTGLASVRPRMQPAAGRKSETNSEICMELDTDRHPAYAFMTISFFSPSLQQGTEGTHTERQRDRETERERDGVVGPLS